MGISIVVETLIGAGADLGDQARAPVTYRVPLLTELSVQLEVYAASEGVKPEVIIAEALRAYLGVDA